MNLRFYLNLVLIFCSISLIGQTGKFRIFGTVYNTDKKTVADWPVVFTGDPTGSAIKVLTDQNGNYEQSFPVASNARVTYQISVSDPCQNVPLVQKAAAFDGEERHDFIICSKNTPGGNPCDGRFNFVVNSDGIVEFHASPEINDAKYYWDFGDGQKGEGKDINHQYPNDGVYVVVLTIGTNSCKSTFTAKVEVKRTTKPPSPQLSFDNGCCGKIHINAVPASAASAPHLFVFNASGDFKISDVSWDFGDGTTDTGIDVKHAYAGLGKYLVVTTIKGEFCTVVLNTWINVIDIVPPPNPCSIDFGFSTDNLSAKFQADLKGATADKLSWDFGDGTSSIDDPTSHTYTKAGEYKVTLRVSIKGEICEITKVIKVGGIINPPKPCNIDFTFSTSDLAAKFLADLKGATADKLNWDFGDGATSSDAATFHIYVKSGEYKVTLRVSINGVVCEITKVIKIGTKVNPPGPCDIDFTFATSMLSAKFQANFKGVKPDKLNWDFGDGGSSSDATTAHTYAKSGEYKVTLYASINGNTCQITKVIKVGSKVAPPTPNTSIRIYEVSPNPAADEVTVYIKSDIKTQVTLTVGDVTNVNVIKQLIDLEPGYNKVPLKLTNLRPGVYIVNLYFNNKLISSAKFQKI